MLRPWMLLRRLRLLGKWRQIGGPERVGQEKGLAWDTPQSKWESG
ncbi:hypothetical protein FOCG_18086 [Fusarium oxysporum f. sp. radicis-lycopersici 26381]|uniref:Uncharacterized protein n=1 Tax=Fusarium oxysporum NRRL 32931 TaxID=660029 RepID=W9HG34_FUSOX|nr:hypothetical protein FOYG_16896 [Fusarium oxysporum NRRL 32931]EWZ78012.1 hypothetical protein FOWG_17658 [Fusarium oxysporum f. sp. lycopersici MN25]EXL39301.1 hypothetical protein FOCG_18086 [Fusarium oxysporum f. sp. radicis-lycopersici 26381]